MKPVKQSSLPADFASYRRVGPGKYIKFNPLLGITTKLWITASSKSGKVDIHTLHTQNVEDILDLNVKQQNDFSGYRGKEGYQATRIPMVEYQQIMKRCGFKPGQGYDHKKFRQILNDSDYSKLRTVPGKI